jgi:beta-mannanase
MAKMGMFWVTLLMVFSIIVFASVFSISRALGTKAETAPNGGCYIGVFREGAPDNMTLIKKFAAETGKKPSMIMWYQDWSCTFPRVACENARVYGAVPHIVWEPWFWGDMEKIKLDNIIDGQWDNYIRTWAKAIKVFSHPVFLRIGHEFNIDGYPWGVINNDRDPKKYVKAFRHIVDIFKKEGTTNVKWVWCFMNYSFPDEPWNNYEAAYPGDDYVDWVGIDGYNWGTTQTWSDWQSFKILFRDQMRRMKKLHPTKPIMVAEFGCAEKGGDKATWIKEIPFLLKTSMKEINAIVWFDLKKETDWRINSTAKSLAAFKSIMTNPLFLSSGLELASLTVGEKKIEKKVVKALKAKSKIVLDGSLSDFADATPIVLDQKDNLREGIDWAGPKDLSGNIYLKWDDDNFYVAAKVTDNKGPFNIKRRGEIWNGDAIELVICANPNSDPNREDVGSDDYQIGFGTGDGKQNEPSIWVWQKRAQPKGGKIVVKKTTTGYVLEAMVPWKSFTNFRPRSGEKVGFDIALDDADKDERKAQLIWNGDYAFYRDPSVWGRLLFTE